MSCSCGPGVVSDSPQTPPQISAYDRDGRLELILQQLRQLLRTLQYRDFEGDVDGLGTTTATPQLAPAEQPLTKPR